MADKIVRPTKVYIFFYFIAILLISCEKPLPNLDGVDLVVWKNDKDGCSGLRAPMIDKIQAQRVKLLGLSESQFAGLFGKPDRVELFKRNQKFYCYFLEPSGQCVGGTENGRMLRVRFNAMQLAKEVSFE